MQFTNAMKDDVHCKDFSLLIKIYFALWLAEYFVPVMRKTCGICSRFPIDVKLQSSFCYCYQALFTRPILPEVEIKSVPLLRITLDPTYHVLHGCKEDISYHSVVTITMTLKLYIVTSFEPLGGPRRGKMQSNSFEYGVCIECFFCYETGEILHVSGLT